MANKIIKIQIIMENGFKIYLEKGDTITKDKINSLKEKVSNFLKKLSD